VNQLIVILIMCLQMTCSHNSKERTEISLLVRSELETEVTKVQMSFNQYKFDIAFLRKGADRGYSSYDEPKGEAIQFKWQDSQGKGQQQEVSVHDVYKPTTGGQLIFTLTNEGWKVKHCKEAYRCH
jgi:hypothetical protein